MLNTAQGMNMQQDMQAIIKKNMTAINSFTQNMRDKFGFKLTSQEQWGVKVTSGEAFLRFKNVGVVITQFTIHTDGAAIQFSMWGKNPNGQQMPMLSCNMVDQLPEVITWLEGRMMR